MRNVLLCLILIAGVHISSAQSTESAIRPKKVYLNSVLGVTIPGFSSLNAELEKAGYLPLSRGYLTRGAGFYTLFPKLRLASIFNFSTYSAVRSKGSQSNWVRATTAGTSLGVIVRNTDNIQLIPYGGLMYSWLGVRLANTAPASPTFGGYLAGQPNQQHMALNQFMGHAGLHLAKPGLGRSAITRNLLIGIRAGYGFPLGGASWKANNVKLSGGPNANGGGTYLNFILGTAL